MSKTMRWKTEDFTDYVEVVPFTDEKKHLKGDECWCNPLLEQTEGVPVISHNVYDNCKSYNGDFGELPEIVLKAPKWSEKKTICVDNCIADVIKYLWDKNVATLGSCCGHGKTNPDIVVGENEKDYERILSLIAEKDSRKWTIKQWQLVDIKL